MREGIPMEMTSFPRKVRGVHALRSKPTFAGFIGQNPRKARGNGTPRGRRVGYVPNRPSNTTNIYFLMMMSTLSLRKWVTKEYQEENPSPQLKVLLSMYV